MDHLSTKPQAGRTVLAFLRSRRIRGLFFLLGSLVGIYYLFLSTTRHLAPGGQHSQDRVQLNGEGELLDVTQEDVSLHHIPAGMASQDPLFELETRIRDLIDNNHIMVFSKTYCPYSLAAKNLLKSYTNEVQVLEVDLEAKAADIKKILTLLAHGHSTFPSIFFDGESIGGKDNLQAIENKGQLRATLDRLGVAMLH